MCRNYNRTKRKSKKDLKLDSPGAETTLIVTLAFKIS